MFNRKNRQCEPEKDLERGVMYVKEAFGEGCQNHNLHDLIQHYNLHNLIIEVRLRHYAHGFNCPFEAKATRKSIATARRRRLIKKVGDGYELNK